jgi:hypothetical protein
MLSGDATWRPTSESVSRFARHSDLLDQLEHACDLAMRMYRLGQDTTEIDAEVDRLLLLIDPDPDE